MSDEYRGLAANISIATALNIASSTNASPIVVTTSAPHGLSPGDTVVINAHATNTAANGVWIVLATPAGDELSLTGSTGNGVGGATGQVQPLDLGTVDIPEDLVDQIDAASVNVPFEGGFDRSVYAWQQYYLDLRRPSADLPDADTTVGYSTNLYFVPDVTALRVYTLPSPVLPAPFNVRRVRFRFVRLAFASGFNARVTFGGTIWTLPGGGVGESWVEVETNTSGTSYSATGWGGEAQV